MVMNLTKGHSMSTHTHLYNMVAISMKLGEFDGTNWKCLIYNFPVAMCRKYRSVNTDLCVGDLTYLSIFPRTVSVVHGLVWLPGIACNAIPGAYFIFNLQQILKSRSFFVYFDLDLGNGKLNKIRNVFQEDMQ